MNLVYYDLYQSKRLEDSITGAKLHGSCGSPSLPGPVPAGPWCPDRQLPRSQYWAREAGHQGPALVPRQTASTLPATALPCLWIPHPHASRSPCWFCPGPALDAPLPFAACVRLRVRASVAAYSKFLVQQGEAPVTWKRAASPEDVLREADVVRLWPEARSSGVVRNSGACAGAVWPLRHCIYG